MPLAALAAVLVYAAPAPAQTIIDEWASVKALPPPALKPVTVDPKTTALLVLDMVNLFCNPQRYTHCPGMIPTVKKLLTEARAKGAMVVYTSIPQAAKTEVVTDLAPSGNEPFVQSFLDKFLNSDLEKTLKDKGITTVIMTGLASNGAILYTAGEAVQKGFSIVIPVDAITAITPYAEQFSVWQFANAPIISTKITLTKSDMIKF
ncbi:MAG: cysteine hydrolase [Hyphomicrobiales bacterium]